MPTRAPSLPREHLVIRGASVLTMDPVVPDGIADVEIADGRIVAVGADLPAPGAAVLDGRGRILMPGFVDTHWHVWGTLLRGLVGDGHATGWFATKGRHGHHIRPEDTAAGVRLALAEGLAAGITTVHDWAHNVLSPEDADANVEAHLDLGTRARFSYGAPSTTPGMSLEEMARFLAEMGFLGPDVPQDMADAVRVRDAWVPRSDGLLTVGAALRGPSRSTPAVYRHEFAAGREAGLPLSMHCAGTKAEVAKIRQVEVLAADGLLGPDLLIAHGTHLAVTEMATLAAAGIPVSVSVLSELRLAMGFPPVRELREAGVRVSLSLDTTAITASADPFTAMRVLVGLEAVRHADPQALPPRTVLELATIEGARTLGLDGLTGSVTPGKRADLVLVRTDRLSMAPVVDPTVAIVHSASAADVETVIVDGRVVKRAGRLVTVDEATVIAEAEVALSRVRARADAAR